MDAAQRHYVRPHAVGKGVLVGFSNETKHSQRPPISSRPDKQRSHKILHNLPWRGGWISSKEQLFCQVQLTCERMAGGNLIPLNQNTQRAQAQSRPRPARLDTMYQMNYVASSPHMLEESFGKKI